jgi:hypothetical protein
MTQMTHDPGSRHAAAISAAVQAEPDAAHVAAKQAELAREQPSMTPVPVRGSVRSAVPGDGVYRTMVLQPGQFRQFLPQDPQRARAVVVAIDEPVILCDNKELASNPDNQVAVTPYPTGFWLPAGLPLVIENRGLVWACNPNQATATRVSVLTERYENAEPDSH